MKNKCWFKKFNIGSQSIWRDQKGSDYDKLTIFDLLFYYFLAIFCYLYILFKIIQWQWMTRDMCLSLNGSTLVLHWSDVTIWPTLWLIKLLRWYILLLKIVWLKKQKDILEKMWISVYLIKRFIHWINIDNIFKIIKDSWLCRCIYKIKIWSLKRKVNKHY